VILLLLLLLLPFNSTNRNALGKSDLNLQKFLFVLGALDSYKIDAFKTMVDSYSHEI
jgi:hypothetical protein